MAEFEVLLVSIDWESQDKVRAIIPSKKFLKPSAINAYKSEYDIVIYTTENDLYFQFAIKTKFKPHIKSTEGKWIPLCNIQDDLWINKGEWRKGHRGINYHHCHSINTIGKIEIGLRDALSKSHNITIDINNIIEDFDFDQLQNDFEGELWNLITSKESKVSIQKIELKSADKTIRFPENKLIVEFIKTFDHISKNPKRELSHTKELRRLEKVIPIAETYRKLSTAGTATLLPSKAVLENYDIYENRYVCFMLYSIHLIVSKNIKYTSLQIGRLEKEVQILQEKILILEDPDPKVNADIVNQEISLQEQSVNRLQIKWTAISNELTFNANSVFSKLKINLKHRDGNNRYWCSSNISPYCLIKFPDSIINHLSETEFNIEGVYSENGIHKSRAGKDFPKFEITEVRNIEESQEKNILSKQKQNLTKLERNSWSQKSILSLTEQTKFQIERGNQVQTLTKKIGTITGQINKIKEYNFEQTRIYPLLKQRLKTDFYKKIKWKNLEGFKPSMTFIQNISYRNALHNYKEILESEGISIEIFDLYEKVTSYGLREIPQVYELWCLVTIIKVLEESFHFKHNKNDVITLLKNIDPKKQAIGAYSKINFANSLAGRNVTLHYQKENKDGKRPDFILEVSCDKRKINLVLDSKFKNYNYKKSIIRETMEMLDKYQEDSDYVFILHPCKDGTFEGRDIRYTNHGGERIFDGEGEAQWRFPFHGYGYIELKPNFTDNLKKLIAMSFEYLLESNKNAKANSVIDPKPEFPMFCISCGGNSFLKEQQNKYPSGGFYYKYVCDSEECKHEINLSYCWNCKTKLFKHGSYWDYHLESNWSIFDIRCPKCGMTAADRPSGDIEIF